MEKTVNKSPPLNKRHLAYYVVGAQVFVSIAIPLLLLLVSTDAARFTLIGCWIATVSHAYFALQAFRHSGARAGELMLKSFYRGETGKFVIVVILLLLTFRFVDGVTDNAMYLFFGFLAVQCVALVAPFLLRKS